MKIQKSFYVEISIFAFHNVGAFVNSHAIPIKTQLFHRLT